MRRLTTDFDQRRIMNLDGRRGNDLIDARDGERDLVYCGTGRDTVRADRQDVLHRCERVYRR